MGKRLVSELMNPNVVCVAPDMSLRDVARLLAKRGVSGAPVVDADGCPVGVVTQNDLVRYASDLPTVGESGRFYSDVEEYADLASLPVAAATTPVCDVMTGQLITVSKDATAADAARLMCERRVHRVLVCERSLLVGIVTSLDLLRLVAEDV